MLSVLDEANVRVKRRRDSGVRLDEKLGTKPTNDSAQTKPDTCDSRENQKPTCVVLDSNNPETFVAPLASVGHTTRCMTQVTWLATTLADAAKTLRNLP